MVTFGYKVKDKSGNTLTGVLEAEDQHSAVTHLQRMGYWVLEAREVRRREVSWNPFSLLVERLVNPVIGGTSVKSLAVFYRQFATMVGAGMTLSEALNSLKTRSPSRRLGRIAAETAGFVESGGRLSDAFARYPWIFPELHISLLRAGESGGTMDGMLGRIADYLEREHTVRQRLRLVTLYPKILVLAVIFIPPVTTLLLYGFREYLGVTMGRLLPMLGVLLGLWVAYRIVSQIPTFRYGLDLVKLSVPKIGSTVRMLALSRFYRAFASLYSAGVPPSQAIELSARACGNWYLTRRLRSAAPEVQRGISFTEALGRTGVMPQMALDMLATGERTGNVDEMLDKAADYTENEAEVATHQSSVVFGVLLYLGIAAYIGFVVVGFYTGLYSGIMNQE